MVNKESFCTQCCRAFKILVHRYLIFSFVAFIIASKFVFVVGKLNEFVLLCAVAVLGFVIVFFGRRGAMYSYFIGLGFLASLTCNVMGWIAFFIEIPLFLAISMYLVTDERNNNRKIKEKIMSNFMTVDDLYPERRDSFEAILKYISNHSVIGIDSPYGNGKSSVVEALRCEKDDWEFITIGILSTTLENVEFCIIREINRVLESYGVFSNPISKVKSFFSHDFAYCVGDFLFESQSYEEQMRNYVDDIHDLGKVIVLNFEDIDRITNIEHLNKIFAICDTLIKIEAKHKSGKQYMHKSGKQYIKVIYQCNMDALNNLFKKKYDEERYVEKYIPHSILLGELSGVFFNNILKQNEGKYKMIENYKSENDNGDIFGFLSQDFNQSDLQQRDLRLNLRNHTVRGAEFVLDKVNEAFKLYKINSSQDFETVLVFDIMKYFFPEVYDNLKKNRDVDRRMDVQRLFCFYEKNETAHFCSLIELRRKVADSYPNTVFTLENFFDENVNKKASYNKDALTMLSLLRYNDNFYKNKTYEIEKNSKRDKITDLFFKLMDLH